MLVHVAIHPSLKDAPSGNWLTLESIVENVPILALGYKYNRRKVLFFVATKGAGAATPGEPYVARFNDALGNLHRRFVPRPSIISRYFSFSNMVDSHNHFRQFLLALEKKWLTKDCWFRLFCGLIGMCTTDAFLACRGS